MGGSATTGSHDTRPRAPGNTFHPFSRWLAISQSTASSRPRCRLHDHAAYHTARMFCSSSSFVSFVGIRAFALRCHIVLIHTGNHAFSSRFFTNPPMHANLRYFAPLPTHSDLCLSADRCTGIACTFTYTVHHSPTLSRLSPPTHATHGMRVSPNPWQ